MENEKYVERVNEYGFGELDVKFIDKYLKHDDETLDEAMARVKKENDLRNNKNK